jgi:NAD(P)-dependent dehydrogenase (short-subunit alcohol dehydrogenase family)
VAKIRRRGSPRGGRNARHLTNAARKEPVSKRRPRCRIALCSAPLLPGDIRDEELCRKIIDDAVRQLGGLDILVNNASRQQERQSPIDISSEDFDATIKTNVYAMFWITKAALPHLGVGSAIIQTTSEQAYDPFADLVDYAMTKAAMMNFTKSLAKQLGPKGIRVNGVAPGPNWTPLQVSGGATQEKLKQFGGKTPLGRPG